MSAFPADVIDRLGESREVDIETTGRRSGLKRRTTIWIVVADGVLYVRSEYGDAGQWYRNALADSNVTLHAAGHDLDATATWVDDPERCRAVSDAFRAKYAGSSAVRVMVTPEVEATTLALAPR